MPIVGIWFLIAAGLLVVEITTTTFYAVFLAVGAAAAGLVAWVLPDSPSWAYALVAFVVSLAGVVIIRPMLGRRLQRRGSDAITPGVHGGFVGQRALTVDEVGDQLHPGHVRLAGETWLAVSETHGTIEASQSVIVGAVRGTTLVVRPAGASPAQRPEG